MSNNMESCHNIESNLPMAEFHNGMLEKVHARGFKLAICREISAQEVEDGLLTNPDKPPESTLFLDSLGKIIPGLSFYVTASKSFVKAVAHEIAYAYYDCMSGGCPKYMMAAYRWLIIHFDLDRKTEVYPGENGWYTFADFIETCDGSEIPDFEETAKKLNLDMILPAMKEIRQLT
jgi:hypothetical protein